MQILNSFYHAITSDLFTSPCSWCDQRNLQQKKCSSQLAWDNFGPSRHLHRVQRIRPICSKLSAHDDVLCIAPDTKDQRQLTKEPRNQLDKMLDKVPKQFTKIYSCMYLTGVFMPILGNSGTKKDCTATSSAGWVLDIQCAGPPHVKFQEGYWSHNHHLIVFCLFLLYTSFP